MISKRPVRTSQNVRGAAYIRMSTDRQEDSPRQQRAEIEKLAKRENVEIVAWYEDHAITGDSIDERPDFRRMLNEAQSGQYSVILCDNQDRFGRFDSIDAGMVISPLRKSGVRMLTNAQGWIDWSDFATRMVFAVQAEGKHQFLRDMSRNITRSFANSNSANTFIRSAPLGMCRVFYDQHGREQARVGATEKFRCPKGWTVRLAPSNNEQEREAIRWAFETYANTDAGLHEICRGLQDRGVLSYRAGKRGRAGNRIFGNVLRNLFTNAKYIGVVEAGNYAKGKYHRIDAEGNIAHAEDVPIGRSDARRGHPVRVFGDAGEPLIDRITFERVQQKLARRGIHGRKPRKNKYLLTGILRCGHCGGSMHGRAAMKGAPHLTYYQCNGRHTGKCDGHNIRQSHIEEYVLDLVRCIVFGPDTLSRINEQLNAMAQQWKGEKRRLGDELKAVEEKLNRARRNMAFAEADDLPAMRDAVNELKRDRDRIVAAAGLAADSGIADRAAALLAECTNVFRTDDPQILKFALSETFDSITLWFDRHNSHRVVSHGTAKVAGFPTTPLSASAQLAHILPILKTGRRHLPRRSPTTC